MELRASVAKLAAAVAELRGNAAGGAKGTLTDRDRRESSAATAQGARVLAPNLP